MTSSNDFVKPLISVVMSVYNGETYVKEAVESILLQSFTDFEFIIINDGSSDTTPTILEWYADKDARIRIISRLNKGLIYSLNEGVRHSRGDYIARMDADDVAYPSRLHDQLEHMTKNNLDICGTWGEMINSQGDRVGVMNYPPYKDKIKLFTLFHNPFIHPSVMLKKSMIEKVGGYRDFYTYVEDYELWTRCVFKYKADNLQKVLIRYRVHPSQVTRQKNRQMKLRGILVRMLAFVRFMGL